MTQLTMINSMGIDELERHTQHLIDGADLDPIMIATLNRWVALRDELESRIDHMQSLADTIIDAAQEIAEG